MPVIRQKKRSMIPQAAVLIEIGHDSGERRFHGKGHEDLARVGGNFVGGIGSDGVIPESVEILPIGADELRAGIFGEDVGGGDIGGPTGHERSGGGAPGSGVGCTQKCERKQKSGRSFF